MCVCGWGKKRRKKIVWRVNNNFVSFTALCTYVHATCYILLPCVISIDSYYHRSFTHKHFFLVYFVNVVIINENYEYFSTFSRLNNFYYYYYWWEVNEFFMVNESLNVLIFYEQNVYLSAVIDAWKYFNRQNKT
jgi:hypothetical protein